jgi:fructose-1,6-bisphosphatase/inositol monophosphatase family enzyme
MLAMQDISPSRKLDADAAAEIAPHFAEVKKSYDTSKVEAGLKAGDYSVERLFTNILGKLTT